MKWQAFSDAVAQYLAIEDERERDHDVALRKAVSGMRTALLKASAGTALIRITRRSRFFQSFRTWKALSSTLCDLSLGAESKASGGR